MNLEDVQIALRCYSEVEKKGDTNCGSGRKKTRSYGNIPDFHRVLILDTETRTDCYMNLTFGSCSIYQYGKLEYQCLFYGEISPEEKQALEQYALLKKIDLRHVREFVDSVFLGEVYELETPCIGFNLPFDLSRLAISCGKARHADGAFSFKLTENSFDPRLIIRHLNSKSSFFNFTCVSDKASNLRGKKRKTRCFQGNFLDLRTLAFVLTDEGHSLDSSCRHFKAAVGKTCPVGGHGKVTLNYIEYNLNDVEATYQLYLRMMEEYNKYHLDVPPTRLFSPASIGKAYLNKMGVKSFLKKNPNFTSNTIGHLMASYYGGRAEVKIRNVPTEIALIDFLSMYPTMCILQNIWKYVLADEIKCEDATGEIVSFIDSITLYDLKRDENWMKLNVICQVEPDEDILPVRSKYGERHTYNIGLNYLTSDQYIWYTLADVLASKLLTGKAPRIIKAIRFVPEGLQDGLSLIDLVGNRKFDPNDEKSDFFLELIHFRNELKQKRNDINTAENSDEYARYDTAQRAVKIVANATSYGVFIEINPKVLPFDSRVRIHGNQETFELKMNKVEEPGKLFNPLLATMVTSTARLALAITEAILAEHGATYAFCDTDSMAVPPEYVDEIQSFFRQLSPYDFTNELFKLEEENFDEEGNLKPLWFYGISSKRYVLYNLENGKPVIRKGSSHGLGHLLNPFHDVSNKNWHEVIWQDILDNLYDLKSAEDISLEYQGLYAISKLAITTPHTMNRFKVLNKGVDYNHQIKPFNFMMVGTANATDNNTLEAIKPVAPFNRNPQSIVHAEFIDYTTGCGLRGIEFWKEMDDLFYDYRDHVESKFDGDSGILQRKHLNVVSIIQIGKESNNLENTFAFGVSDDDYRVYSDNNGIDDKIIQFITNIDEKTASRFGILPRTLRTWKQKIENGRILKLRSNNLKKIENAMRAKQLMIKKNILPC